MARGHLASMKPRVICICLVLSGCGVRVLVHDQKAAATSAEQFARAAFVAKDLKAAYAMLAPQARQSVTQAAFSDTLTKMHPKGHPDEVSAVEYETLPGQAGMYIYLKGRGAAEDFYYRMLMVGDKVSGYRVSFLGRGSAAYPPSNRRPL